MKKKVILFGGELFNKGAQAMTFVTVDEMTKRFPDHEIILFSTRDSRRSETEKKKYKFRILPFPGKKLLLAAAVTKKMKFLKPLIKDGKKRQRAEILQNADYVLDISGYALGSDWGCKKSMKYCRRMKMAKLCGAKVYLMPQSFGPFDYKGEEAGETMRTIRKCLPCAEKIMAREEEGFNLLKSCFGLRNVVKSYDIVLQNQGIDIRNIYREEPSLVIPEIAEGAVGIIPNTKTIKFCGEDVVTGLYDVIISELKACRRKIYFMIHSAEDRNFCRKLYDRYRDDYEDTFLIDRDLSCLEFDGAVRQFDFIAASRYHSVVHAYRNEVPAIVLGWAVKYRELMDAFGQAGYQFNVREDIDPALLQVAVRKMATEFETERKLIRQGLKQVRKENAFDYIQ